jgi:hypothetical protein
MTVKMWIIAFWGVAVCNLAGSYQCSTLKMEEIHSFKTLVTTYKTIGCHNLEDRSPLHVKA